MFKKIINFLYFFDLLYKGILGIQLIKMKSINITRKNEELIKKTFIKINKVIECKTFFYYKENNKILMLILYNEILKKE